MLPRFRGGGLQRPRRALHLKRRSGEFQAAHRRLLYFHEIAPRGKLRVGQHFLRRLDDAVDETVLMRGVEHFVFVLFDEVVVQNPPQLFGIGQPRRGGAELVIVQFRQPQKVDHRLPIEPGGEAGAGQHMAVGGGADALQVAAMVGLAAADGPGVGIVVDHIPQPGGHRFLNGDVDVLAPPRQPLVIQRHQRGGGGVGARLELRLMESVFQRLAVIGAENIHQPAQRILHDVGGLIVAVGAGLPEIGNGHHHQLRKLRLQFGVAQPQRRHHAGGEVLHQQVGVLGQGQQRPAPLGGFEVEGDALLVGVEVGKGEAVAGGRFVAVEGWHPPPRFAAGPLHFQHRGAEIGQQLGAVRPGDALGEVENGYAFEGSGHSRGRLLRGTA